MGSLLTPRGSTRGWRRVRALVLARDGRVCRYCGGYAGTVDHVVPRALGGSDASSNLVAACRTCNRRKGAGGLLRAGFLSTESAGHLGSVLSPSAMETSEPAPRGRRARALPEPSSETAPCYRCQQQVPINHFGPDPTKASGRKSICLPCDREKSRAYYAIVREVSQLPDESGVASRAW